MGVAQVAGQFRDGDVAKHRPLAARVQPAPTDDENRPPTRGSRFADKLLDPVASTLGAKAMQVACAFRSNAPPGKRPQGFARDAMACPRDDSVLRVDNQRAVIAGCAPGGWTIRIRRRREAPVPRRPSAARDRR